MSQNTNMAERPGKTKHNDPITKPMPAQRGRPSAERAEEINQGILDAARDHFLTRGFDTASMESIAKAQMISKNTLYSRYPSKEHLLRAVIEMQIEQWSDYSTSRNDRLPLELEGRLRHTLYAIVETMTTPEAHAFERLSSVTGARAEVGRAVYDLGLKRGVEFLAKEIENAAELEGKPVRSAYGVAEMLFSTIYGWIRKEQLVREVSVAEARLYVDASVELLYKGRDAW